MISESSEWFRRFATRVANVVATFRDSIEEPKPIFEVEQEFVVARHRAWHRGKWKLCKK
jgi:hypothetical protein